MEEPKAPQGNAARLSVFTDAQARQVADGVARGHDKAFESLYDAYQGRVMRFALVLARGNESLAEEIVQSTFLSAAQKLKRVESEEHLWNWLAQVARQHGIKAWKARDANNASLSDPLPDLPAIPSPDTQMEEHLDQALHSLEVEDRQTIEWHYFDNLSHKEIADRMGTTAKAVSSRLERARARLRSVVQKLLSHET